MKRELDNNFDDNFGGDFEKIVVTTFVFSQAATGDVL